ncbi:MAG: hypothetical protein ACXVBF_05775 [Flavisolibacter sp.]
MKFFTESLYDSQHGILEFHFERIGFPSTTGYKVAVINGQNKTYNFTMKPNWDRWKIADPSKLPDWIIALEEELSDSLRAHFRKASSVY